MEQPKVACLEILPDDDDAEGKDLQSQRAQGFSGFTDEKEEKSEKNNKIPEILLDILMKYNGQYRINELEQLSRLER